MEQAAIKAQVVIKSFMVINTDLGADFRWLTVTVIHVPTSPHHS